MDLFNQQIYMDHLIHFNYKDDTVLVNATDMANAFNKQAAHFLRLESTQRFLIKLTEQVDKTFKISQDAPEHLEKLNYSERVLKVVYGGKHSGTWMHRKLAIYFAAWLDPEFLLWIINQTDQSIGKHKDEYIQMVTRMAEIQKEDEELDADLGRREVYRRKEANRKESLRLKRKFAAYNKQNIDAMQMTLAQQPKNNQSD